jgi:hypothetical protein
MVSGLESRWRSLRMRAKARASRGGQGVPGSSELCTPSWSCVIRRAFTGSRCMTLDDYATSAATLVRKRQGRRARKHLCQEQQAAKSPAAPRGQRMMRWQASERADSELSQRANCSGHRYSPPPASTRRVRDLDFFRPPQHSRQARIGWTKLQGLS